MMKYPGSRSLVRCPAICAARVVRQAQTIVALKPNTAIEPLFKTAFATLGSDGQQTRLSLGEGAAAGECQVAREHPGQSCD